ncbi:MAG: ribonuclease E inhibitor RraB [Proteobacteria bacterium]|nr:MAG: ribonuclease E inhibitor RraB [Pseudomonadota bacterium]
MDASTDAAAIAQLAKSGKDLSKPQRLQFLLAFETEDGAASAVAQLDELAFTSTIEQDDADGTWVAMAAKTMFPVESDLQGLRQKLEVVAKQNGGKYRGWRAAPSP